jgi:hypothetical protein
VEGKHLDEVVTERAAGHLNPDIRKTWLGPARPDRVGLEVETRLDPHFSLLRSLLENYSSQTMHTAPAHVCGYICANIRINEDYTHERPFGMLATVFL